ncbi:hypothetical protein AAK894_10460 [Lachnospiraceae bacterium 46-61]
MQINQFIMICLIVITIVTVVIFMINVVSSLTEWIMGIVTIIFTAIFTIIVSTALFYSECCNWTAFMCSISNRQFNSLFKEEVQEEKKENLK